MGSPSSSVRSPADCRSPKNSEAPLAFRSDVQGLRGIAVLLVVIFHSGIGLSGGYTGVDVFFVISGFVIARLLLSELESTGTISLRRFYLRRVKRLLPAIAVAAGVTLVGAVFFLSPLGPQQWAAMSAIAASVFGANFYLYATGDGYFDPADETNPFLHYWSLSVEEQFYLVLPALLIITWKAGVHIQRVAPRTIVIAAVGFVFVASLLMSWTMTADHGLLGVPRPARFAFYSPLTRAWEFVVGVALALGAGVVQRVTRSVATVVGTLGAVAVLWAALEFDEFTPFPGVAAAVPVVGTALLLIAGGTSPIVNRVLSTRALTWVGDLSFGWYLWHWPAIVYAGAIWPENTSAAALAAVISLLPAWLSYQYLENPIRRNSRIVGRHAVQMAGACIALPILLAVGLDRGANARWGLDIPDGFGVTRSIANERTCDQRPAAFSVERCLITVADSRGTILLVGDSHAAAISDAVVQAGNALGFDVGVWTFGRCAILGADIPHPDICSEFRANVLALIEEMRPDHVVISHRSNMYTDTEVSFTRGPTLDRRWNRPAGLSDAEALDLWTSSLDALFEFLGEREVSATNIAVVPYYEDFPRAIGFQPLSVPSLTLDDVADQRDLVVVAERTVLDLHPLAFEFDPVPSLCPASPCRPLVDDEWTYFDPDHLSLEGNELVAPALERHLGEILAMSG